MEKKRLTCIICPLGCEIIVGPGDNGALGVKGNRCDRGYEYAINEVLDPRRVLTSTVRVVNGVLPVVPVKTMAPVPKSKLFDIMAKLSGVQVYAPVKKGQVILKNVDPSGIDLIATRDLPAKAGTSL